MKNWTKAALTFLVITAVVAGVVASGGLLGAGLVCASGYLSAAGGTTVGFGVAAVAFGAGAALA